MPQNIPIKPFSIAALEKETALNEYDRVPELVDAVSNEVCSSPGGCFLITGYRGVGKTSFVNKVLQTTESKLKTKTIIVPVKLSLARGYSTDKLLRRLIRELFYAIDEKGLYDKLDDTSRQQLTTAFLRTSRQIKTAMSQGLKEAFANTESTTKRFSTENKFEGSIGVEKLVSLLGSFSAKREKETSQSQTHSRETSNELGMEIEFLEYDDEIAESDLSRLIDLFQDNLIKLSKKPKRVSRQQLRWPNWFWRIFQKVFPAAAFQSVVKLENTYENKNVKLLFVLDEIDKISIEEAEVIFRSLKNLFLKGNVFFFLVTGKTFYYEWLRKRTSEDDIFFSLFTRIIHIPLFSDDEFNRVASKLSANFPADLLTHLKYRAKGTPREFFRELSRFVDWSSQPPTFHIPQTSERLLEISGQLYPYIQKHYAAMGNDERVDVGIRDHLRRSLHNWLEWMTILVNFTKPSVMRSTTEGEKESDKMLLSTRTTETFDQLFQSLLHDGIIRDTKGKISEENVYTFTDPIREKLAETDSTVSSQLPSARAEQERHLNSLAVEFYEALESNDFEQARALLPKIAEYTPQDSKESTNYQRTLIAREMTVKGDQLYEEKLYNDAFSAYGIANTNAPDSTEIKAKLVRASFALAFEMEEKARQDGDFSYAARGLAEAIEGSRESFEIDIAQMKKDARERYERLRRIPVLEQRIRDALVNGDLRSVAPDYKELYALAPELRSLERISDQMKDLETGIMLLEDARQAMSSGELAKANKFAQQALSYRYPNIDQEAKEIIYRIEELNKK